MRANGTNVIAGESRVGTERLGTSSYQRFICFPPSTVYSFRDLMIQNEPYVFQITVKISKLQNILFFSKLSITLITFLFDYV